jgi:hypothetical protein
LALLERAHPAKARFALLQSTFNQFTVNTCPSE